MSVDIRRSNRICGPGATFEASIDGEVKAYIIQEKDNDEPRAHLPRMVTSSAVVSIVNCLNSSGMILNEIIINT